MKHTSAKAPQVEELIKHGYDHGYGCDYAPAHDHGGDDPANLHASGQSISHLQAIQLDPGQAN
jgi:hypothetical protein